MTHIYEPEIEEDDGYSIPKILVAVLLLILIGAGAYIYMQQKKLKSSVTYLLDSKKSVEQDLNQMIEKYNLAIDDNGSLESELKGERDFIIRYRDSIRNIKSKDFTDIANYNKTILKLKEASAIQFTNASASIINPVEVEPTKTINDENVSNNKPVNKNEYVGNKKENPQKAQSKSIDMANNEIASEEKQATDTAQVTNIDKAEPAEEKTLTENISKKGVTSTSFTRVEIPPTYPGCTGTPVEKKACFSKKVQRHVARKFNASIVDNLDITSGTKRMWVHFNVDEFGNVTSIVAKGPHEKLEKEAVRVIKSLPKMSAAKQNGTSVQISYSIPTNTIIF